jgi:katanin p60 ATPase-containing subunit A1
MKLGSDVDLKNIAMKLEGYSGCDITNVCRDAAMMGMRRKIAGIQPDEMRKLPMKGLDLPITAEDFKRNPCQEK